MFRVVDVENIFMKSKLTATGIAKNALKPIGESAEKDATKILILKIGDKIASKRGRRYKILKCRGKIGLFRLQDLAGLQVLNGEWTPEQLANNGAIKI